MKLPLTDLIAFQRDQLAFFTDRGNGASDPLVPLSMGAGPVYLVTDADLVKPILRAPEDQIDKGQLIYKLREIIGETSMALSAAPHRLISKRAQRRRTKGIANQQTMTHHTRHTASRSTNKGSLVSCSRLSRRDNCRVLLGLRGGAWCCFGPGSFVLSSSRSTTRKSMLLGCLSLL